MQGRGFAPRFGDLRKTVAAFFGSKDAKDEKDGRDERLHKELGQFE